MSETCPQTGCVLEQPAHPPDASSFRDCLSATGPDRERRPLSPPRPVEVAADVLDAGLNAVAMRLHDALAQASAADARARRRRVCVAARESRVQFVGCGCGIGVARQDGGDGGQLVGVCRRHVRDDAASRVRLPPDVQQPEQDPAAGVRHGCGPGCDSSCVVDGRTVGCAAARVAAEPASVNT